MDKQIEEHVRCCHPCQLTAQLPLPTELPSKPWTHIALDVCGPFPTGEHIVVLTDYDSPWPEAEILKTVTSRTTLTWLNSVFAHHGYPEVLKSDSASYFTSAEFKDTLPSWDVELKTVTEYWPQANSHVEHLNVIQNLTKHILTAQAEGKDWRTSLPNMLLQYRTTPHLMTGQTPAQLLFNRELKTKIPSLTSDIVDTQGNDAVTRQTDAQAKEKAKTYTDEKRHAFPRNLKTGDLVLVSQRKQNKSSTRFCKDPLAIKEIRGTQLILTDIHGKQQ